MLQAAGLLACTLHNVVTHLLFCGRYLLQATVPLNMSVIICHSLEKIEMYRLYLSENLISQHYVLIDPTNREIHVLSLAEN